MYKFRGRTPQKMWVKGYYFAKPILDKHFILNGEEQWAVDKETVGMYVGNDKLGNELYVGDIVSYHWSPECPAIKMVITYEKGICTLEPVTSTCPHHDKCVTPPDIYKPCPLWGILINEQFDNIQLMSNIFDMPNLTKD